VGNHGRADPQFLRKGLDVTPLVRLLRGAVGVEPEINAGAVVHQARCDDARVKAARHFGAEAAGQGEERGDGFVDRRSQVNSGLFDRTVVIEARACVVRRTPEQARRPVERKGLYGSRFKGDRTVEQKGARRGDRVSESLGDLSGIDAPARAQFGDEPVLNRGADECQVFMGPGDALDGP